MLEPQTNQNNDNGRKNIAVQNWLADRSQMIVMYCKLTGIRNQTKLPEDKQINGFCGILIDYVSAGHFEVYQEIVNDCDIHGSTSIALLESLYPEISQTTDIVVDFNQKYSQKMIDENDLITQFDSDLSVLGEAIAKRVDLEDSLIDTLNTKH